MIAYAATKTLNIPKSSDKRLPEFPLSGETVAALEVAVDPLEVALAVTVDDVPVLVSLGFPPA